MVIYPLVNCYITMEDHNFQWDSMGKSTINGPFSIAILNYQRVLVWTCSLQQRIFVDRICYNMLQPQMHRKNRASKTSLQMGKPSKTYENPHGEIPMRFQGNQHPQIASERNRRLFRESQRQKSVTVAQCLVNMDSPPENGHIDSWETVPFLWRKIRSESG